ncbi:MAG: hypothetical protein AAGU78_19025, partial [Chloroflexota bacterium]
MAEYPDLPPDLPIDSEPEPPIEAASSVPLPDATPTPEPEPVPEPVSDPAPARQVVIEDLTLAEALRYLWWRPATTGRLLWGVLTRVPGRAVRAPKAPEAESSRILYEIEDDESAEPDEDIIEEAVAAQPGAAGMPSWTMRVVVLVAAILLAVWGGVLLNSARLELEPERTEDIGRALSRFLLSLALAVGFEVYARRRWWARRFPRLMAVLRTPDDPKRARVVNGALLAGVAILFLAALLLPGVLVPVLLFVVWLVALLRLSPVDPALEIESADAEPGAIAVAEPDAVVTSEARGFW